MSMPRPRAMIIPIACVVEVQETNTGYRMDTFTAAEQINHQGIQQIASQIFDSSNEDLDPDESQQTPSAPFIIASHTLAMRHPFSAYKMTTGQALDPNVKGVLLTQDEFCQPMQPGFYYYIIRGRNGSQAGGGAWRSGRPGPRLAKSASRKSAKKKSAKKK